MAREHDWISIAERLPKNKQTVLVFFCPPNEKSRISACTYIAPKTVLEEDWIDLDYMEGFHEYDEEKDCYWAPGGFYEFTYMSEANWYLGGVKILLWKPIVYPVGA